MMASSPKRRIPRHLVYTWASKKVLPHRHGQKAELVAQLDSWFRVRVRWLSDGTIEDVSRTNLRTRRGS